MRKGTKMSEEAKEKIRQARLGTKHSSETKEKIRLIGLGRQHSEETKLKIGLGNKGKIISIKQREQLRQIHLGSKLSEETKKKIGLAGLGSKHSEETKKKISEAQLGEKSHSWRGGRCQRKSGYVLIKTYGHPLAQRYGYVLEHRLVMEKFLGRYLTKKEVVHHINNIKNDNRIENLILFNNELEHKIYHAKQKILNYFLVMLIVNKMKEELICQP